MLAVDTDLAKCNRTSFGVKAEVLSLESNPRSLNFFPRELTTVSKPAAL